MKRKYTHTLIVFLVLIGILLSTSSVQAQGLPCTCSGTTWIWFTPLYLGGPTVTTGALVYSPFSTLLYANLNIGVSGKWHLGDYLPGVQACWIRVWKFCLPLPSLGLMTK